MVIPTVRPSDRRDAEPVHAVIHRLDWIYCQSNVFQRHTRQFPCFRCLSASTDICLPRNSSEPKIINMTPSSSLRGEWSDIGIIPNTRLKARINVVFDLQHLEYFRHLEKQNRVGDLNIVDSRLPFC